MCVSNTYVDSAASADGNVSLNSLISGTLAGWPSLVDWDRDDAEIVDRRFTGRHLGNWLDHRPAISSSYQRQPNAYADGAEKTAARQLG